MGKGNEESSLIQLIWVLVGPSTSGSGLANCYLITREQYSDAPIAYSLWGELLYDHGCKLVVFFGRSAVHNCPAQDHCQLPTLSAKEWTLPPRPQAVTNYRKYSRSSDQGARARICRVEQKASK